MRGTMTIVRCIIVLVRRIIALIHRTNGFVHCANGFAQRGPLPEAEISAALSASAFGISDQEELSLMKSGTFMAYAAHGLNIHSRIADSLAAEPLCWLTSPAELRHGISADQLHTRAANLRTWQERTSSWPRIADEFAGALQLTAATTA